MDTLKHHPEFSWKAGEHTGLPMKWNYSTEKNFLLRVQGSHSTSNTNFLEYWSEYCRSVLIAWVTSTLIEHQVIVLAKFVEPILFCVEKVSVLSASIQSPCKGIDGTIWPKPKILVYISVWHWFNQVGKTISLLTESQVSYANESSSTTICLRSQRRRM